MTEERPGADACRLRAPAKVNPTLAVLGRRPDGYHEVDTTLVALELADEVVVTRRRGAGGPGRVTLAGPCASADVPRDGRNLAARALDAARAALVEAHGAGAVPADDAFDLHLVKNIPSQAGLGGGSSDAAAAFRAVERLCGLAVPAAARAGRLAALGADCVFFDAAAATGAARATGVGEHVAPCPAPDWHVFVVTPAARCATAAVYGALELPAPAHAPDPALLEASAGAARPRLYNDLEAAALRVAPELVRWRALLDDLGRESAALGAVRLSGSGSSWFGLAVDAAEGAASLEALTTAAGRAGLPLRTACATRVARVPGADAGPGDARS